MSTHLIVIRYIIAAFIILSDNYERFLYAEETEMRTYDAMLIQTARMEITL